MNLWPPLAAGLLFGLANAAHCAGMCGVFALRAAAGPRRFCAYGLGKLFTYLFIGALFGAFGQEALPHTKPLQVGLTAIIGIAMAFAGVAFLQGKAVTPRSLSRGIMRLIQLIGERIGAATRHAGGFVTGALTGALPCGVVYLAALAGTARGNTIESVVLMSGLGLGTLPVLAVTGFSGEALKRRIPARTLRLAGGSLLLALAAFTLGRAVWLLMADTPDGACPCCL